MNAMLSVEEALERVLAAFHPLEAERVPILEALGRVLAVNVEADSDIPPCANSSMDGYAVQAKDTQGASNQTPKRLRVICDLPAGYVAKEEVSSGTAIRIMTGAPLPAGADAVVRVEDTRNEDEWVDICTEVPPGHFVRPAGEDVRKDTLVLEKGMIIRPQEVGMLAALGCTHVEVTRRPRVAILATGDELVDIDKPLMPGKIRNVNSYSNTAQVLDLGGIPITLGIARDRIENLTERIRSGLKHNVDLLLTSGGVSVGDFDMVKRVLAAEGDIYFWRVRMKPGKPLAFGHISVTEPGEDSVTARKVPILGLPGNPVSAMVSFEIFARPAILKMMGARELHRPVVDAILVDEIREKDNRRHFVRVRLERAENDYRAHLTGKQGSGILSSMVKSNGLAIIPENWSTAPAGSRVMVIVLG